MFNLLHQPYDVIQEQLLTVETSKEGIQAELSEVRMRYESSCQQVDQLTKELQVSY